MRHDNDNLEAETTGASGLLEDQRIWRKIQPVAESLLSEDRRRDEGDLTIREFDTEATMYRACAISLADLTDMTGGLLVMVERKGSGLPTTPELRARFDLTPREAEVARLLARRRTNREIADGLCISPYTARRHTEQVLQKLSVDRRTEVESVLMDG